jgi:hypothetical protein
MKPIKLIINAALAAGIMFGGDGNAQDVSHLPPEKAATVLSITNFGAEGGPREERLDKLDPILVGENVVFSKTWLEKMVGPNKPLSRKQFEAWRNTIDKQCQCLEEFTGGNPGKIYICTATKEKFARISIAGTRWGNSITYNLDNEYNKVVSWGEIRQGAKSSVAEHELAHAFAGDAWKIDSESMAELLRSYVGEKLKNDFSVRRDICINLVNDFKNGTLAMFSMHSGETSAYRFYLFGLVERVGWDTYKKAIHSYNGAGGPEYDITSARDFLDRLEYFSGKPGVLRTLPDRGKLLDEHFNVEITEKPYTQPAPPPSPPPTETPKVKTEDTSTPEPRKPMRSYVNKEIEALNKGR